MSACYPQAMPSRRDRISGRLALLAALLVACCSTSGTTVTREEERIEGAAVTPLNDLNIVRVPIPDVLAAAQRQPYAVPVDQACEALAARIVGLDEVLGPDLDVAPADADSDTTERVGRAGNDAAIGALRRTAEGVIPFRSWVRKLTGAERHSKEVAAAIAAGAARRAYLKGIRFARGCS